MCISNTICLMLFCIKYLNFHTRRIQTSLFIVSEMIFSKYIQKRNDYSRVVHVAFRSGAQQKKTDTHRDFMYKLFSCNATFVYCTIRDKIVRRKPQLCWILLSRDVLFTVCFFVRGTNINFKYIYICYFLTLERRLRGWLVSWQIDDVWLTV